MRRRVAYNASRQQVEASYPSVCAVETPDGNGTVLQRNASPRVDGIGGRRRSQRASATQFTAGAEM